MAVLRYFHKPPNPQSDTTTQQISTINNTVSNIQSTLEKKVTKSSGRGLSENNYSTPEKNKLRDIEDGAEVNVQADWNETDTTSDSYILNKPDVPILDPSGQIPAAYLPSYVDDVIEYNSVVDFPSIGEKGKIYVDTSTDIAYRWSGSTYIEISKSIVTGVKGDAETDYRIGNINLTAANIGLSKVVNLDLSKAIKMITRSGTTFTYTCLDGTTGTFTQQDNNTTYSAGTGLSLTNTTFALALTKKLVTDALGYTPPTTDTTYSAGTGLLLTNTAFSVKLGYTTSGNNRAVQADANGNLYVTLKDDNTWTAWKGATASAAGTAGYMPAPTKAQYLLFLRGDGTWVSLNNYSLPLAANGTRGGILIGYTQSGKNYPVQLSGEKAYVNVPWTDTTYTLPLATSSTRGGAKVGFTTSAANRNYAVLLSNELMYVNVPWTDTNTTYTFTDANPTLAWSTKSKVATIGGVDIHVTMPANPNTDTNTWRPVLCNGTSIGSNTLNLKAGSNVSLSNSNGTITITSTDTNTWPSKVSLLTNDSGYITGITKAMVTTALGYTPPTTDHTYNFAGVSFTSGQSNTGEHNANNIASNGVWYYTSNGPAKSLGASTDDGALYSQAYSTSWVGQIAQDYRNGRLFVRGKNNGSWQSWLRVALTGEALPASDVYAWAKASSKPSYAWNEITSKPTIPTKTSQLTNDSGYITGITKAMVTTALGYTPPTQDTNTWRGIQDNLTSSTNTTESLSAKQGYLLANGSARDSTKLPLAGGTMNSGAQIIVGSIANSSGNIYNGGIQLRERGYATTSLDGTVYTDGPGITFHWGGRWVHMLNMHSNALYWDNTKISLDGHNHDSNYVASVSISGNNLRINKNGANTDLTIPYATSAGNADTVDSEHANAFAHRQYWNNMVHSGNEYTWIAPSYNGDVWINYRTASGSLDGNITQYNFGNGRGRALASITAGTFNGNCTGSAGSVAWGNVTGKPSTFTPSSHTHDYLPLTGGTLTGQLTISNDKYISVTRTGRGITFGDGTDTYVGGDTTKMYMWQGKNLPIVFGTNGSERMRVTSDGTLSVGSSNPLPTTQYKLYVSGNGYFEGNVSATTCASRSDLRLKDIQDKSKIINIEDIANAPIITFKWKNKDIDEDVHVGTSAQYWNEILPEAVSVSFDDYLLMDYGATALSSAITVARKTVEHEEKIKQLEDENKQLKEELLSLKSQIKDILAVINSDNN